MKKERKVNIYKYMCMEGWREAAELRSGNLETRQRKVDFGRYIYITGLEGDAGEKRMEGKR